VLAALVAGVLLVRLTDVTDSSPREVASSPSIVRATSTATPTKQSAVAAALADAAASQGWLYLTDDELRAAIAKIATPAATKRLTEDELADVAAVRDQLQRSSGRIWWLVRPLAWRVEDFRDTEARVSVWTVTVLSATEVASPQSEFVTLTVDLQWIDDTWRIDGVSDTPGPTPMTGPKDQPWDAEPFDQVLAGFTRLEGAR
jgi:hypothetical protein